VNAVVPLSPPSSPALSVLVAAASDRAGVRFLEFFAARIRNAHTRRAYADQTPLPEAIQALFLQGAHIAESLVDTRSVLTPSVRASWYPPSVG
jgi:hypothetical protein